MHSHRSDPIADLSLLSSWLATGRDAAFASTLASHRCGRMPRRSEVTDV